MNGIFVEATKADGSYQVVWRGDDIGHAFEFLQNTLIKERLELWSREHAASPNGFAPLAYREGNSTQVLITNTLKMLMFWNESDDEPTYNDLRYQS